MNKVGGGPIGPQDGAAPCRQSGLGRSGKGRHNAEA